MKKSNLKTKMRCVIFVLLVFCFEQIFAAPCGDVNSDGTIDIVDALLIAQQYVGLNPSNFDQSAADVNGDGNIDIVDALLIAQYYVGLITSLPGCNTPSGTTYELQAEDTATWANATVDSDNAGYTGSGFVNTENASGTWIEWSLNASQAGNAVCVFTYSNGSTDNRPMDVSVNNNYVTNLSFPVTSDWTAWTTQTANVNLNAGTNTIRLTATSDGGAPNMDKMEISFTGTINVPEPTSAPTPAPVSYDILVARDGSGNYTTVQAAFDAAPSNSSRRWVIYVKNGTYKEMLNLASNKNNITLIGQSNTGTILTYDNYASKINPATGSEYGTSGSASTFIYGSGFYAWNITFENSAGTVGQALALNLRGDKAVFNNCRFVGNQDTFYGDRCRHYFYNCYLEGTTDFIFGPSIAFFESCRIYTKGGSAITAASTESYVPYGYVFNNCTVTGSGTAITDLGRPWRPYASVTFMNSSLSGAIKSTGWNDWGDSANQATARFAEYNNTGNGSSISGRPSWIKRLSSSEAANYTVLNVLKGTNASPQVIDNWNPQTVIDETRL